MRGKVREAKDKNNEMRALNRIIRLDAQGALLEADPKHAEILVNSMGLEDAWPVVTAGDKSLSMEQHAQPGENDGVQTFTDGDDNDNNDDHGDYDDSTNAIMNFLKVRTVEFDDTPDVAESIPDPCHYEMHPSQCVVTKDGKIKNVQDGAYAYTGKGANVGMLGFVDCIQTTEPSLGSNSEKRCCDTYLNTGHVGNPMALYRCLR